MNKKKCEFGVCRNKINLVNLYSCKCGLFFCGKHKFYTDHNCGVDVKKIYKEELEKTLIKCEARKIDKI
jgi:hypothetical protein